MTFSRLEAYLTRQGVSAVDISGAIAAAEVDVNAERAAQPSAQQSAPPAGSLWDQVIARFTGPAKSEPAPAHAPESRRPSPWDATIERLRSRGAL
jgi:hypothetical protein